MKLLLKCAVLVAGK